MAALEAEKATARTRLDQLGAAPPVRLHPNLGAVYTEKVARLADALNAPETKVEAGEVIRSLIERIVLTPEGERLKAELYGDLAGILALCDGAKRERGGSGGIVSVVAGARSHLYRTSVTMPFKSFETGLTRPGDVSLSEYLLFESPSLRQFDRSGNSLCSFEREKSVLFQRHLPNELGTAPAA